MTSSTRTAPPDRSLAQRLTALERANAIRTKRAALKRELKAGRRTVDEVLDEPPAFMETCKVFDLLLATPKVGRVKANKLLTAALISPSKTVGGLSRRQRRDLIRRLATVAHGTDLQAADRNGDLRAAA